MMRYFLDSFTFHNRVSCSPHSFQWVRLGSCPDSFPYCFCVGTEWPRSRMWNSCSTHLPNMWPVTGKSSVHCPYVSRRENWQEGGSTSYPVNGQDSNLRSELTFVRSHRFTNFLIKGICALRTDNWIQLSFREVQNAFIAKWLNTVFYETWGQDHPVQLGRKWMKKVGKERNKEIYLDKISHLMTWIPHCCETTSQGTSPLFHGTWK